MSEIIQISLNDKGDILIPASIREHLHLSPGMTLVVEKEEKGNFRLRVQEEKAILVKKGSVLIVKSTPVGDFSDIARNERDRRLFDLLQRTGL